MSAAMKTAIASVMALALAEFGANLLQKACVIDNWPVGGVELIWGTVGAAFVGAPVALLVVGLLAVCDMADSTSGWCRLRCVDMFVVDPVYFETALQCLQATFSLSTTLSSLVGNPKCCHTADLYDMGGFVMVNMPTSRTSAPRGDRASGHVLRQDAPQCGLMIGPHDHVLP